MKRIQRIISIACVLLLSLASSSSAQCPVKIYVDGNTDNAVWYPIEAGFIYAIMYTERLPVTVSGDTPIPTTGTVTLFAGAKQYQALYAGPLPGFPDANVFQVNFAIPRDEFNLPMAVFIRACDTLSNCTITAGATLRRVWQ